MIEGVSGERDVLHVGNILNNGYLHCKYLRRRGMGAESLNVDYRHCQGQPEWTECLFSGPLPDYDVDWRTVAKDFIRPSWYHETTAAELIEVARALSNPSGGAPAGLAKPQTMVRGGPDARSVVSRVVSWLGRGVAFGVRVACRTPLRIPIERRRIRRRMATISQAYGLGVDDIRAFSNKLIAFDRAMFPGMRNLTLIDILEYLPNALAHRHVFDNFKLIHGYSLDPIMAMLGSREQPFICYEHGTMRDFPFEDSARGRLYRVSLHRAEKVFITNADCIASAKRLGLTNWVYIPHLIDDDRYRPEPTPLRQKLCDEMGVDHLIIAPARHHWKNAPPGLANSFWKRNDILIHGLARFFAAAPHHKVGVVFFEFGQEVALSKELITKLGIGDRVRWEPLQGKVAMKEFMNAADVVCDQFHKEIKAFGSVVGEGLACGKPVISTLDKNVHLEAFPVLPPILHALDEETIAAHLTTLFDDPEYRDAVGHSSYAWFTEHHSSSVVIGRMINVYREIADRHGWGWRFN